MAKDQDILDQVNQLVAEEKELRAALQQRRALRETGGDPGAASVRLPDEVEGYLN